MNADLPARLLDDLFERWSDEERDAFLHALLSRMFLGQAGSKVLYRPQDEFDPVPVQVPDSVELRSAEFVIRYAGPPLTELPVQEPVSDEAKTAILEETRLPSRSW
jgi:hypothetical protein